MNTSKHIAIIGHGYVGTAIERFFSRTHTVVLYDPAQGYADKDAVNACPAAVICVPTPMSDDGSVDTSIVEDVFSWLSTPLIVIKSTVPPGTTQQLAKKHGLEDRLCFAPEYIGEGNYPVPYWDNIPHPTDMSMHSFHIFGGKRSVTTKAIEIWKRAAGPFARFVQTDATTAELTKYMENSWIATKITFVNEYYDIARTYDVDFNELRELWLMDGRVGRSHTLVYEQKRGFDGKCIPKDTNGIVAATKARGYEPVLLTNVLAVNQQFLTKNTSATSSE